MSPSESPRTAPIAPQAGQSASPAAEPNSGPPSGPPSRPPPGPPSGALAVLVDAARLRAAGRLADAVALVDSALAEARQTPLGVPFPARIQLGLALADLHLAADATDRARSVLAAEVAFAEQIYRLIQRTGTPDQVRATAAGRLQVRDRATQVALLGQPAPALDVADWVLGAPTTLAEQRGRVVLLEFWATWCRPCLEMFPRLTELHAQHAEQGLTVLALTCYGAVPAPAANLAATRASELQTVRQVVADRGLTFGVGIAPDERLQRRYGATGIPTLVLVDRAGIVRFVSSSGEEAALDRTLRALLAETPADAASR